MGRAQLQNYYCLSLYQCLLFFPGELVTFSLEKGKSADPSDFLCRPKLHSLQDPVGNGGKATAFGLPAGNASFLLCIEEERCMRPIFKDMVLL